MPAMSPPSLIEVGNVFGASGKSTRAKAKYFFGMATLHSDPVGIDCVAVTLLSSECCFQKSGQYHAATELTKPSTPKTSPNRVGRFQLDHLRSAFRKAPMGYLTLSFSPAQELDGILRFSDHSGRSLDTSVNRNASSIHRGVAKAALYCVHRATTASSWGLCEQEGHLAAPLPFSAPAAKGQQGCRSYPLCPAWARAPINWHYQGRRLFLWEGAAT